MSEVVLQQAFMLWMYSILAFWIWGGVSVGFLVATPRSFLDKYFSEPYFGPGELAFLSGFPTNLMRNVMFIRLLASPSSGKKRGLTEAYKDVPGWLIKFARFLYISLLLVLAWLLGMTVFWCIYIVFYH